MRAPDEPSEAERFAQWRKDRAPKVRPEKIDLVALGVAKPTRPFKMKPLADE
jgi:hypothetical protein